MRIEIDFEMDADGVRRSGQSVLALANSAGDVVVDLGAVSRLDSSGIGLLVHLRKRKLEANERFSVINVRGQPRELLGELRLLSVWAGGRSPVRTPAQGKVEPVLQNSVAKGSCPCRAQWPSRRMVLFQGGERWCRPMGARAEPEPHT
jgi:anti-anti-sigma regulatory factor